MSISGPEALAALDEALRDLRREEDDILRKLLRGLERLAKIRDSESELLRQLAALELPTERAAALVGALGEAAQALRQTLDARGREFAAAVQHRRQLETALGERRSERAARLGEIDHGQQQLRALASRLGATAKGDAYDRQRKRQRCVGHGAVMAEGAFGPLPADPRLQRGEQPGHKKQQRGSETETGMDS